MTTVGFWLIFAGYLLAIAGSALLYFNTPKDVGIGRIPIVSGKESQNFFKRQENEIISRAVWSRRGFGLLLLGSSGQLAGVVLQWMWPFTSL